MESVRLFLQVVVSPFGVGEVTEQDLEAILCGCFLVKPGAGSIHAYPDFLQTPDHVMEADLDWMGLQDKLKALDLVRFHFVCTPFSKIDFIQNPGSLLS